MNHPSIGHLDNNWACISLSRSSLENIPLSLTPNAHVHIQDQQHP